MAEEERQTNQALQTKLKEMQNDQEKLKHEYERVSQLRGAYNADKKVLVDRI